jgi:LPS export ABC transporter protein LptC
MIIVYEIIIDSLVKSPKRSQPVQAHLSASLWYSGMFLAHFLPLLKHACVIQFFMLNKILFVAVTLASLALFFYITRSEKATGPVLEVKGNSFVDGLRVVNRKDGLTEWVLLANRADMSRDGKEARLTGIEMQLESQGITIRAEQGLYNMETKQVSVARNVSARSKKYFITADRANIDSRGSLETSGAVKIEGAKFMIEGKGMEADNIKQKVRILKNVKATFNR